MTDNHGRNFDNPEPSPIVLAIVLAGILSLLLIVILVATR